MTGREIIIISETAKNIDYEIPSSDYTDNKSCAKSISNAWKESVIIDQNGVLWVCEDKVHTILRTTKSIAKYYISKISNSEKRKLGNSNYIRGSCILKEIDIRLQTADTMKKENYLRYSIQNYEVIRDAKDVKLIRLKSHEKTKESRKTLKRKRIKEYKSKCNIRIKEDELTNEPLRRDAEFSHIRSCSAYPELVSNIDNGHIVNKETHKIITENNVNDEDELLLLCEKQGWNTSWYKGYKKIFS